MDIPEEMLNRAANILLNATKLHSANGGFDYSGALKLAGVQPDFCSVPSLMNQLKDIFVLLKGSLPQTDQQLKIDNTVEAKKERFLNLCYLVHDAKTRSNLAKMMRYAGFQDSEIHREGGGATTEGTFCRRRKLIIDKERAASPRPPAAAPPPPPPPPAQQQPATE